VDTNTETYIDNIYVGLMTDMIALGFAGIFKINKIPRRQISRTDAFKGQVLKPFLPKFIRDRVRSRTDKIFTPTRADYLSSDKVVGQGSSVMCIWHNFFLGMILAFLRMDDQAFPKNRCGLQDASAIPLIVMPSITSWIKEIGNLRNNRNRLEIMQDPRKMSPWNTYLQVLNFPAYIGPVSSIGNSGSDGDTMRIVDTTTSTLFPSNIGSSIYTKTAKVSSPVARLPKAMYTAAENTNDREGKKKRKISYPNPEENTKNQRDSTGFI
jgi:hypothetical protein